MLDLEALPGQLRDKFLDGMGFMQFDQAGTAFQRAFLSFRSFGRFGVSVWHARLDQLIVEQIQVAVLLVEGTHFRLAGKVRDPLDIPLAHLHEIRG